MTSECTRFTPSLTLKVKGTGVRGPKPTGEARTGRSIATLHSNTASGAASHPATRHHLFGGGGAGGGGAGSLWLVSV